MKTQINQHGEKVSTICTVTDGRGGRTEVTIVEFSSCGKPDFALHGAASHSTARRFSTLVKRAKSQLSHESMKAEWFC